MQAPSVSATVSEALFHSLLDHPLLEELWYYLLALVPLDTVDSYCTPYKAKTDGSIGS